MSHLFCSIHEQSLPHRGDLVGARAGRVQAQRRGAAQEESIAKETQASEDDEPRVVLSPDLTAYTINKNTKPQICVVIAQWLNKKYRVLGLAVVSSLMLVSVLLGEAVQTTNVLLMY